MSDFYKEYVFKVSPDNQEYRDTLLSLLRVKQCNDFQMKWLSVLAEIDGLKDLPAFDEVMREAEQIHKLISEWASSYSR